MIETLSDIKLFTIPFLPNIMLGKDITHTNTIEVMEIRDHDRLPVMVISQITHTIIPIKSVIVNSVEITTFFAMLFSSFLFKAIKF